MLNLLSFLDNQPAVDASSFCSDTAQLWKLVGTLINIIKIVIPVIIIVLAMLDLGKAVMAGEEKEIQAAQKMLIKRLIYGVVIFFVVTIVQTIFNLIGAGPGSESADSAICWECATRPNGDGCVVK